MKGITMNTTMNRPTIPLLILSVCLLFLAIGGFIGGYYMMSDPNGAPMGMPVSDLARTPFQNFLLPGLLLILIWGFGSLLVLTGLWVRPQWSVFSWLNSLTHEHWAWALSVTLGVGLVIWLLVQFSTLPAVAHVQYILVILALLLIMVPMAPSVREYYQIE
jgi:hypothetical protein